MGKITRLLPWTGVVALLCFSYASAQTGHDYAAGLGVVQQVPKGQGGVSICVASPAGAKGFPLIIPAGTIFADAISDYTPGQAFITTQTVVLTADRPCDVADASSVVSHTRHWLTPQVLPQFDTLFQPVGETSGNGVDTGFEEEDIGFRRLIASGAVTAHVLDRLHDTIYLTESNADIEDPDAPPVP